MQEVANGLRHHPRAKRVGSWTCPTGCGGVEAGIDSAWELEATLREMLVNRAREASHMSLLGGVDWKLTLLISKRVFL